MRIPLDHQRRVILQRLLRPSGRYIPESHQPSHDLRYLDVDQVRCVKVFVGGESPLGETLCPIRAQEELEYGGRVDHDQRLSRSFLTTSVGEVLPR